MAATYNVNYLKAENIRFRQQISVWNLQDAKLNIFVNFAI